LWFTKTFGLPLAKSALLESLCSHYLCFFIDKAEFCYLIDNAPLVLVGGEDLANFIH